MSMAEGFAYGGATLPGPSDGERSGGGSPLGLGAAVSGGLVPAGAAWALRYADPPIMLRWWVLLAPVLAALAVWALLAARGFPAGGRLLVTGLPLLALVVSLDAVMARQQPAGLREEVITLPVADGVLAPGVREAVVFRVPDGPTPVEIGLRSEGPLAGDVTVESDAFPPLAVRATADGASSYRVALPLGPEHEGQRVTLRVRVGDVPGAGRGRDLTLVVGSQEDRVRRAGEEGWREGRLLAAGWWPWMAALGVAAVAAVALGLLRAGRHDWRGPGRPSATERRYELVTRVARERSAAALFAALALLATLTDGQPATALAPADDPSTAQLRRPYLESWGRFPDPPEGPVIGTGYPDDPIVVRYDNPAAALLGTPMPTPEALAQPPRGTPLPGSAEHMVMTYADWLARHGKQPNPQQFARWLPAYVQVLGNRAFGAVAERLFAHSGYGLPETDGWIAQARIRMPDGSVRILDFFNPVINAITEVKGGDYISVRQRDQDALIVTEGVEIPPEARRLLAEQGIVVPPDGAPRNLVEYSYWFGRAPRAVVLRDAARIGAYIGRFAVNRQENGAPVPPAETRVFSGPEPVAAEGSLAAALQGVVAEDTDPDALPADVALGGIDFSSLELRYVSDTSVEGVPALSYAFRGQPGEGDPAVGLDVALEASDAFFTWLALPPEAFTVNLNPAEPFRIIDAELGRTDAGRALLEADLQLKRTTAALLRPDTELGRAYWDAIGSGDVCTSARQWIVPGEAVVREDFGALHILEAPLDVRVESEYLAVAGGQVCPGQSPEAAEREEAAFRSLILPRVIEAVNTAPEYAALRRVYLSRVAAEWYRERAADEVTAFGDLVGSGDIGPWASREPWDPQEVFREYVRSFNEGEFKLTEETVTDNYVRTVTYFFGGVDFTHVPRRTVTAEELAATHPGLADQVEQSLETVVQEEEAVWLGAGPGAVVPPPPPDPRVLRAAEAVGAGPAPYAISLSLAALLGCLLLGPAARRRVRSQR